MKSQFHEEFYSFAKYYDIAFDFKDVAKECSFLKGLFRQHTGQDLESFIEFGAGPALHCIEMAKTLSLVTAVDLSAEMTEYAKKKAQSANVQVQCECADMIGYSSLQRYDMATLLMDSAAYLLTNEDVITHLQSVGKILNSGGLYVLEMNHPKSVFDVAQVSVNDWEMQKDDVKVKIQWGAEQDVFDPISQITEVTVKLEYEDGDQKGVLEDCSPQRCFTATEFAALVAASGAFEIVEFYGAMDASISFSNDKKSWRMIPVLRKI